ncbi:transcriptional regulator, Fis family, partial [Acidovorax delafieldii 2AN]
PAAPSAAAPGNESEGVSPLAAAASPAPSGNGAGGWEHALESEAQKLLSTGHAEVWDALTRRFESRLIRTALAATHGRRMEAAQRLGIGRNTITRKIQELGLDAPDEG